MPAFKGCPLRGQYGKGPGIEAETPGLAFWYQHLVGFGDQVNLGKYQPLICKMGLMVPHPVERKLSALKGPHVHPAPNLGLLGQETQLNNCTSLKNLGSETPELESQTGP